ncbi:hypothetical protein [Commensalibacter communis]|uniref:hypothetical protein n=1 Tax=Commensalibacter communis TaxID=2972786 RepID=UPI00232BD253|nr:hypothetical protein [Commensalibacter communis]
MIVKNKLYKIRLNKSYLFIIVLPFYPIELQATTNQYYPILKKTIQIDVDLVKLLKLIPKSSKIPIESLQKLFNNTLERSTTPYIIFYKGGPYQTKDGTMLMIEIRNISTKPDVVGILDIRIIKDSCVAIDTIKNPFQMIFLPPYTLHDAAPFYYEAPVDWGIFAISVSPFRKNCIDSIVIRGFGDDREKQGKIEDRKASLRGEFDDFKKAFGVQ